jgi:hypothetical protein
MMLNLLTALVLLFSANLMALVPGNQLAIIDNAKSAPLHCKNFSGHWVGICDLEHNGSTQSIKSSYDLSQDSCKSVTPNNEQPLMLNGSTSVTLTSENDVLRKIIYPSWSDNFTVINLEIRHTGRGISAKKDFLFFNLTGNVTMKIVGGKLKVTQEYNSKRTYANRSATNEKTVFNCLYENMQ